MEKSLGYKLTFQLLMKTRTQTYSLLYQDIKDYIYFHGPIYVDLESGEYLYTYNALIKCTTRWSKDVILCFN